MARREAHKESALNRLTDAVCEQILAMQPGEKTSLLHLADAHYTSLGYTHRHLGLRWGYGWTKDGGRTYVVTDFDLFTVLDRVQRRLNGQRWLDFGKGDDGDAGFPYSRPFTVRLKAEASRPVTWEQARAIASAWLSDIDRSAEYEHAYWFGNPRSAESIGGPDMPLFVRKADGRRMPMNVYLDDDPGPGEFLREIPL